MKLVALSRRHLRTPTRRQSLPHRRRRIVLYGRGPHARLVADPQLSKRALVGRHQAQSIPHLGEIEVARSVERHARPHRSPHAADRRHCRSGVWLASGFGGHGLNTDGDGRRTGRARHRRGRPRPGGCLRLTNWSGPAAGSAARLRRGSTGRARQWSSSRPMCRATASAVPTPNASVWKLLQQAHPPVPPVAALPVELAVAPVPEPVPDKVTPPA